MGCKIAEIGRTQGKITTDFPKENIIKTVSQQKLIFILSTQLDWTIQFTNFMHDLKTVSNNVSH